MTKRKYTMRPWEHKSGIAYGDWVGTPNGQTIANVNGYDNAELIAAAPDMVEALLAAHEFMKDKCYSCKHYSSDIHTNGCALKGGGCKAMLKVENALRKAIGWRSAYEQNKERRGEG